MNIIDIINKKKEFKILTETEIKFVVENYTNGNIKDYQMSTLLMAILLNGMNDQEIFYLTKYMCLSGDQLTFDKKLGTVVDKHSTGGVGDKTTLIVGPLVAACGVNVAKMSGRGLGLTGGTIDKLESIPGINLNLTEEEFVSQISQIKIAIVSQTKEIAIADKKIYALRNATGTVDSIPLIASSIMSKKLACGASSIVMDIKVGKGAFVKNLKDAKKLAKIMINIGKKANKKIVCLITNMDIPLGYNIGNSIEIEEALEVLKNDIDCNLNLKAVSIELASHMVSLGLNVSFRKAQKMVIKKLLNGEGYQKFLDLINYQNGQIGQLPKSKYSYPIYANQKGYLTNIDASLLAKYCFDLGSGRLNKDDPIDYSVGVKLNKKINDKISKDDLLLTVYSNQEISNFAEILKSFTISSQRIKLPKIIYDTIK